MKLHNIGIDDLRLAERLHAERQRLLGLLAEKDCGLLGVGPFFGDAGLIAAVLPSYRNWLLGQVGTIAKRLVAMGLSITDPDLPANEVCTTESNVSTRLDGLIMEQLLRGDVSITAMADRMFKLEQRFDTFVAVDDARHAGRSKVVEEGQLA